jgi:predicted component of type VI protein secretion system
VRLIIEDLEGSTTVVNLGTEEVTIGRKPHNTIQLTEQNVSRSHAKLIFQDEGWLIHDLGSYNGVKVNGVPIAGPTQLHESDLIQIGDYHLTLTDDVDRETVDIERPRAANDGIVAGAMTSSSDLPSMSVEDLEPMRPPGGVAVNQAHVATAAPQKGDKGKLGVIIGVVGTLVAVIAIAILVANSGGDDGGSKDEKAAAQSTNAPDEQPEPAADAGPTPVPEPEPVPEVEDTAAPEPEPVPEVEDTAAPEPAEGEGDDGELVAETGVEEEPEPEPDTSDKPKPKPKPRLPPDQALAEARKASMQGNNRKAYSLAKDAYDQNKSGDALNLMGVAACKMGSASKAKSVHRKMTAKDKGMLEKLCGSLGIEL